MNFREAFDQSKRQGLPFRGQTVSGVTGTMAAALAANALIAAVRYPAAGVGRFVVQQIHLNFSCIVNFTTVVTAGRQLQLRVGSGGDVSGGTDLDVESGDSIADELLVTGQIATTGALTANGATLGSVVKRRLLLGVVGSAGQSYDELWTFPNGLVLDAGQLVGITTPTQLDAGGTWQLGLSLQGCEVR